MKKVVIAIGIWCCLASVQAQTFGEWFKQKQTQINYYTQQIAALKVYGKLVQKGYQVASDGLALISSSKERNFDLHSGYFTSLYSVNPFLRTAAKTRMFIVLYDELMEQVEVIERTMNNSLSSPWTISEKDYVLVVTGALKKTAQQQQQEYILLTTGDNYSLTDAQRLQRITALTAELRDQYHFTKTFHHQLQRLGLQRAKEISDRAATQRIHDLKTP